MAQEKRFSIDWPDDPETEGIPAPIASGNAYRPGRPFRTLARLILLSAFFFTLYIWSGGKFNRFTGGEKDLWIVDAFVHHGHSKHGKGQPLRGKAAEKLYL
jgi:hypothetical protein